MSTQLLLNIVLIISLLFYFYLVFKDIKLLKEIERELKKDKEPLPEIELKQNESKDDPFNERFKEISERLWGKNIEQTKYILNSYDYDFIKDRTEEGYKYLLFYSRDNGGLITVFEFDPDYPSYRIFRTCANQHLTEVEVPNWFEKFITHSYLNKFKE